MLSLTDIDRFIAETWNVMLSRERSWLVTFDHQLVVALVVLVPLPISNVMEKKIKDEFSMMMSQAYLVSTQTNCFIRDKLEFEKDKRER